MNNIRWAVNIDTYHSPDAEGSPKIGRSALDGGTVRC